MRTFILSLFLVFQLSFAHEEPLGLDEAFKLPIFDAHMHYKERAWEKFPESTVLSLMDKNGVAMALVSSTPDEGTIKLLEYAPERIIPELRPYHEKYGSANWTQAPHMAEYLEKRMEKYPHKGIGEFHIHQLNPDEHKLHEQIAALAIKHNAIIHVHSDDKPVTMYYEIEPNLTIIWAHAGMISPPEVIDAMMTKYPTLMADTSYREKEILEDYILSPEWKALLIKFQDRFMVGSDTWDNSQWERYSEIIHINREWLSMLPKEVAEKIAYKNAEKLFGIRVSDQLIGNNKLQSP